MVLPLLKEDMQEHSLELQNTRTTPSPSPSFAKRAAIVIPARLRSLRLPEKLLLAETGRPLLAHTIEQALAARQECELFSDVLVACDDDRLVKVAESVGAAAILCPEPCASGSDRIAMALQCASLTSDVEIVINLQADQPEISPNAILQVTHSLIDDRGCDIATVAVCRSTFDRNRFHDPNVVKAVVNSSGHALYFSRAPIPFEHRVRSQPATSWLHHLGLYAYRLSTLRTFTSMHRSRLETAEDLEQLRWLEAGGSIKVVTIPAAWAGLSIDTRASYDRFVRNWQDSLAAADQTI